MAVRKDGIEIEDENYDFGDVIVHIMLPATRVFYDIERLWSVRPNDTDET